MSDAYSKKKNPDAVRRLILDAVETLAATHGPASITIQAVANFAGVTKGGVTHHFASKQALIEAMLTDVLGKIDIAIDQAIDDEGQRGCFTRAYVRVLLLDERFGANSPFDAISLLSIFEPALGGPWFKWLDMRMQRHAKTDDDPMLEIVRLAADGAWLAYLGKSQDEHLEEIGQRLMAMSR